MKKILCLFAGLFLLTSCLYPQPPNLEKDFVQVEEAGFSAIRYTYDNSIQRQLLFVVADDFLQNDYKQIIASLYPQQTNPPRAEDILWWRFAPYLIHIYGSVTVLKGDDVLHKNVMGLLDKMAASTAIEFDVIFATHGLAGRLSTGLGGYFLSFRELEKLEGKYHNLRMVFMQSCRGDSLNDLWHATGAKQVLSFGNNPLNRPVNLNFIWIDPFLRFLRWSPDNPKLAWQRTEAQLPWMIEHRFTYLKFLEWLGWSTEFYLENQNEVIFTEMIETK